MQNTSEERILGPAIRILNNDRKTAKVFSLPLPNDHENIDINDIFFNGVKVTDIIIEVDPGGRINYGYYTNFNTFVNRVDAMVIAKEANQIVYNPKGAVLYAFMLIDFQKRNLK